MLVWDAVRVGVSAVLPAGGGCTREGGGRDGVRWVGVGGGGGVGGMGGKRTQGCVSRRSSALPGGFFMSERESSSLPMRTSKVFWSSCAGSGT